MPAMHRAASRRWNFPRSFRTHSLLLFALLCGSAVAGDLEFRTHLLDGSVEFMAAAAMDVNKDGKLDIVCGSNWYEGPSWTKHHTRDVEILNGRPDGYAHLPIDVNGDGWTDLVIVNWRSRTLQWAEHPGPSLGEWKVHQIEQPGNMESGRLVDMDGDGQLDLLPSGSTFAAWWSFERALTADLRKVVQWTRHPLPQEIVGHGIGFGDVNSDGRIDVIGPTGWAEAPVDRRNERWMFHEEFFLGGAPVPVLVQDVDKDGDNDLVTTRAHDFGIYWFENTGNPRERNWVKHVIDTSWSGAHSPLWGDLDKDGNMELIVGKRYRAHEGRDPGEYDPQYGYRYEFDPKSRTWHRWLLTYNEGVGFGLDPKIADLDSDGDEDLLLAGRHGLYWLENLGRPHAAGIPLADDPGQAPRYATNEELLTFKDQKEVSQPVKDAFNWGQRRAHIAAQLQQRAGVLSPHERVPLKMERTGGQAAGRNGRFQVSFNVTADKRITGNLYVPIERTGRIPGVVVFSDDRRYTGAITSNGMLYLQLDPGLANVWNTIRACDVLESLPESDVTGIGVLGVSEGTGFGSGGAALIAGVQDQRIRAVVVADYLGGDEYNLRNAVATMAPRPLLLLSRDGAANGGQEKIRSAVSAAAPVYALRESPQALKLEFITDDPRAREIGLPSQEMQQAAQWFNEHLRASPLGGGARGRGGRGRGPAAE